MRLPMWNRQELHRIGWRTAVCILAAVISVSCARSAPELPADFGSVDAQLPALSSFEMRDQGLVCEEIDAELLALSENALQHSAEINKNRASNQIAGYFGILFIVPALGLQTNTEQHDRLNDIQERWDTLVVLKRIKECKTRIFDR